MSDDGRSRTYCALSLGGGGLVLAIALLGQDEGAVVDITDRRLLGLVLLIVASMGILSAVRPNWRQNLADGPMDPAVAPPDEGPRPPGPPRRGHHPECEGFVGHTVTIRGRVRCAGCTGLAAGAFGVMLLVYAYVVSGPDLRRWEGMALVVAGLSLTALDLGVAYLGRGHPWTGLGLNALMVVGFGLVSVGLLEATGQLAWGLVGTVVSVLWMDTRIQVSRGNHAAVCALCPEECVAYFL